jgi:hypothetical protein
MIKIDLSFIRAFSPNEQLVMLHLLLHADKEGVVEFSDRGISRLTGIPYQQVRTIHQKWSDGGTITNAFANAHDNAKRCFVTICDYDSYNVINIFSNAVANAVTNALKEVEITKDKEKVFPHTPLQRDIENNKDEDIKEEESNDSKKKEPVTDLEKDFEAFRRKYKEYGGSARGFSTEFDNLKKKHKDWKEIIPMLAFALENENRAREDAKRIGKFFPQMKNLQTYINQRYWEAYSDGYENYDPDAYHPEGFPYDAEFDAYRFCDYIPNHDLLDGYTDDNRPDGARIVEQITVWVWSSEQRRWNKELKK